MRDVTRETTICEKVGQRKSRKDKGIEVQSSYVKFMVGQRKSSKDKGIEVQSSYVKFMVLSQERSFGR